MREAVKGMNCSKVDVVAHVGTNDVVSRGSEEILSSVRDLCSEFHRIRSDCGADMRLTICTLVPRVDRGSMVWSRVDGINRRLRETCGSMGARFLDLRPVLDSCRVPLNLSGVHYTDEASQKVARRIHDHTQYV
jgi:hypothetical protein